MSEAGRTGSKDLQVYEEYMGVGAGDFSKCREYKVRC